MLTLVETPLTQILYDRIRQNGPMTVADFMSYALYDPDHGYYTTHDPIGAGGDFITAPETSQIFGELIGLWALETWRLQQGETPLRLVEMGPGHGTLAQDMLRTLTKIPGSAIEGAPHIRLDLVEISPVLRARQQEKLAAFSSDMVEWFDRLEDVPPGPAIIIGNEFLDALPIRQFVRRDSDSGAVWHELMVTVNDVGRLDWYEQPADDQIIPAWARNETVDAIPTGSVVESCPELPALVAEMANRLCNYGGAVLLIDYGYDASLHPAQATWVSTLQAIFRHQSPSPLERVGDSDITAHVDFGTIVQLATAAGLTVTGPIPQGQFLQSLGGDYRCQQLMARHPDQAHDILTRWRRLITPRQMGHLFKVIILSPGPTA